MLIRCRAGLPLVAALLTIGILRSAAAAEIKLADISAQEDSKRVTLRFTFSEPLKPDVTYFYTHNYVGLRAAGLKFSANQLKTEIPATSQEAKRAYRFVRFVQDRESGEIRLYLTKPLTPADAQVVPYETYTEITLLKPAAVSRTAPANTEPEEPDMDQPAAQTVAPPSALSQPAGDTPPTLRPGGLPSEIEAEPSSPVVDDSPQPLPADPAGPVEPPPANPPEQSRVGGPSYAEFDLNQVPVKQLTFKGIPFREAIMELVAGTGYNIVVSDDVDNGEVTLNFNQKQLSLKSALDLLAMGFDLEWSVQPDAIVIKAKPQP